MRRAFDAIDHANAIILLQHRAHSLPAQLITLHQTHTEVVATLRQMPFDKLRQPRYASAPEA